MSSNLETELQNLRERNDLLKAMNKRLRNTLAVVGKRTADGKMGLVGDGVWLAHEGKILRGKIEECYGRSDVRFNRGQITSVRQCYSTEATARTSMEGGGE